HLWPGNVRELAHTVERAVLIADSDTIRMEDLGLRGIVTDSKLEDMTLDQAEEHVIRQSLERHSGNVNRAADQLGVSRSALYRRLQRYGMTGDEDSST
ncbi:MAG: sigma-54-dependent Fis family transcriptional regulator, partial [Gemmatimonadota bacterium]|nr:sigma-54-dependent Fis family transcriptional regulator [Gemmatimonadota bacterium]